MAIPDIIKSLGGATVLAEGIGLPGAGVGALRVRAWAQRRTIPGQYWASIAAYARNVEVPVTLEVLAAAHAIPLDVAA